MYIRMYVCMYACTMDFHKDSNINYYDIIKQNFYCLCSKSYRICTTYTESKKSIQYECILSHILVFSGQSHIQLDKGFDVKRKQAGAWVDQRKKHGVCGSKPQCAG